jgi:hypothetical protein
MSENIGKYTVKMSIKEATLEINTHINYEQKNNADDAWQHYSETLQIKRIFNLLTIQCTCDMAQISIT